MYDFEYLNLAQSGANNYQLKLEIGYLYQTQINSLYMSLLTSNCLTWKDKHHHIVQRLAEAGAAHCQRGVEVIKK